MKDLNKVTIPVSIGEEEVYFKKSENGINLHIKSSRQSVIHYLSEKQIELLKNAVNLL